MAGREDGHPYREEKPLAELIPPDRRKARLVVTVVASMLAGALLLEGGRRLLTSSPRGLSHPPVDVELAAGGVVPPSILRGPDSPHRDDSSRVVVLPPRVNGMRSIVHVWLQGCGDCMPAFEAMRRGEHHAAFEGAGKIVNVAYGAADPVWAQRYGVDENLVVDPDGKALVKPLGIRSFTTLVVDEDGRVVHRDRPDRYGYEDRVRAALTPRAR